MEIIGPNSRLSEELSLPHLPPLLVILITSVLVWRAMHGIKRGMEELGVIGNRWGFLVASSQK